MPLNVGLRNRNRLSLGVSRIRTVRPARKSTHAAYPLVSPPATTLSRRLHRPLVPIVRPHPHRLGPLLSPSLPHRMPLHRRPGRPRSLVSLPSFLLPLRLVAGRPVPHPGSSPPPTLRSRGAGPAGGRRH